MNVESREVNSAKNFIIGIMYQVTILGLNLISKFYFISVLGKTYLGINGLFTNLFLVLAFAEHGIGPVMMFALYKPLAEQNQVDIQLIYQYFRRVYKRLSILIGLVGLLLLPVIPLLINSPEKTEHVQLAFMVYLTGIVINNLYIYKSHMIVSDQRKYIVGIYQFALEVLALLLQIAVVIIFESYVLYLVVFLVKNILFSGILNHLVYKLYPFLKGMLPKNDEFDGLKSQLQVKMNSHLVYRFARVLLTSTDNVLISVLVGTIAVGYYTNYDFVIVGVMMLVTTFYSAIAASVGNLLAKESLDEQNRIYDIIQTIGYWIVGITTTCLIVLIQDFIQLWLGSDLLMDQSIVWIVVLNYYLICNRNIIKVYRNAAGEFERIKHMMIIAAAVNMTLSIVLGRVWGVFGILLATTLTTLFTFYWFEAKIIIVDRLGRPFSLFIRHQLITLILTVSSIVITSIVLLPFNGVGLGHFILKAILCFLVTNAFFLLVLRQSTAYKLLKDLLIKVVKGVRFYG